MSLIPERIERVRSLTTFTNRDLASPSDERCRWSVDAAIQERVEYEELIGWGRRAEPAHRIVPPVPETKPDKLSLYRFISAILP